LTQHDPDLGEATTFPHIVFSAFAHGTYIRMAFCLGLSRKSLEIVLVWTPRTLGVHNSQFRPPIGMKSESKLVALLKIFPTVCFTPFAHTRIGSIPDF
jgi:hypothetical protein